MCWRNSFLVIKGAKNKQLKQLKRIFCLWLQAKSEVKTPAKSGVPVSVNAAAAAANTSPMKKGLHSLLMLV